MPEILADISSFSTETSPHSGTIALRTRGKDDHVVIPFTTEDRRGRLERAFRECDHVNLNTSMRMPSQVETRLRSLISDSRLCSPKSNDDLSVNRLPPVIPNFTYSLKQDPTISTFLRATQGRWNSLFYHAYHTITEEFGRFFQRRSDDKRSLQETSADFTPTKVESEIIPDPELVICDIVSKKNGHNKTEISQRGPDHLEIKPSNQTHYTWAIGALIESHTKTLDMVCTTHLDHSFNDLTIKSDKGLRKVQWQGDILIAHVPRFEPHPDDPLKVVRHVVELIMDKDTLVTVDHDGDNRHLLQLFEQASKHHIAESHLASVESLADIIIERQLSHTLKVTDRLDDQIVEWESEVRRSPLPVSVASERIPTMLNTLDYLIRKLNQTEDVVLAVQQRIEADYSNRGTRNIDSLSIASAQSLKSVVDAIKDLRHRVERLEDDHDRQRKVRSDRILEQFTIIIGISAPPIIADFVCKYFLPGHESLHPLVIGASLSIGVGLAVFSKATDWLFKFLPHRKATRSDIRQD